MNENRRGSRDASEQAKRAQAQSDSEDQPAAPSGYQSHVDPAKNAQLQAAFDSGAGFGELFKLAKTLGVEFSHGDRRPLAQAIAYRNRGGKGARILPEPVRPVMSQGRESGSEEAPRCFGPPAAPGTGASQQQLIDQVHINGEQAAARRWNPFNLFWFRDQVNTGAPWDYKQYDPDPKKTGNHIDGFENFGNYNYGYTGAAMGIGQDFLLQRAGMAQKKSLPEWGKPGLFGLFGGTPPYGDDPWDQEMIKRGIADRRNGC